MKKILIALLSVSLLLSGCTAGKKEEVYEENPEVQAAFEQFLQDEFVYYLSQNKLNAHFAVEDLSAYGLEDMEVSLGDVQEQFDYTVLRTAL
ncbi:MAG: hypothetical protein HUJ58_09265, partial [Erysipelotrichaceae bacterium]|nr:hypothetical protein [Erysipelotrichaceae bacterium]